MQEIERRLEPRVEVPPIPVYALSDDDIFFYGYAKNISHSGMMIMSYLRCEAGQECMLEFAIPARQRLLGRIFQLKEEIPLALRSRISWCVNSAIVTDGPNRHGVKFIDMTQGSAKHIESLVKAQLKV